jgi:hypothetical protein
MLPDRDINCSRREEIPLLPVSVFASGLFALICYGVLGTPQNPVRVSPLNSSFPPISLSAEIHPDSSVSSELGLTLNNDVMLRLDRVED